MLRRLLIRNFAIVDTLELEFPSGFGALTGETGAGKSILVDALALVLGERADAAVVRSGCARAEIGAEFALGTAALAARWLESNDFQGDADTCLLRRVIESGGRSRAYINGAGATATQMRELGGLLVDIHGQHAHHALLRAETQRQVLDAYGNLGALATDVAQCYREWRQLATARREAESNAEALLRERDLLEWQINELRELAFDPKEWQEIGEEHNRLANASSLLAGAAESMTLLEDGEFAAVAQAARIAVRLSALGEYDAQLREAATLTEEARIRLDEAAHILRRFGERLELDPQRLSQVELRLDAVQQIARKHRTLPAALPSLLAQWEQRAQVLRTLSDTVVLTQQEERAREAFFAAGQKLSAGRAKTAAALAREVTEVMQRMAMEGGSFDVCLEPFPDGASYGLEEVEFHVVANPSQPSRPLAKVASGGELSRIGLAIQVIASAGGCAATLVFDEVDVGIGGRVAELVGRMLRKLGRERQVLCVTHLPQVAAQADWQWAVRKQGSADAVVSQVTALESDARIEEIARMLAGVAVTATTRRHAREMLEKSCC